MPTLRETLQWFKKELVDSYDHESEVEAIFYCIADHLTGMPPARLRASRCEFVLADWEPLVTRLKTQEPIQYILGTTWFGPLKLLVNPDVLIPRPETEELVRWILEEHPTQTSLQVLDLGTGSGCIPLLLKYYRPNWKVCGADVSEKALNTARENASVHHLAVEWILLDMHQKSWPLTIQPDIVVSNPPYIIPSEKSSMKKNVLDFEPELALFVPEEDPGLYYRKIATHFAHQEARPTLYFETGAQHHESIIQLLQHLGYSTQSRQDMYGHPRMIQAKKKRPE